MKLHKLVIASAICLMPLSARAVLVPLSATGWNQDVVVESSATPVGGSYVSYLTATMDAGTGLTGGTWFQNGLTGGGTGGFPAAGTIITSTFDPSTTFTLQPYTANNAVMNGGTLTLTTPTKLSSIALFGATGGANGTEADTITIHFSDGTPDFTAPALAEIAQDWFNGAHQAITTAGRLNNVQTGTYDNLATTNPGLYQDTISLAAFSNDPVSGLTIVHSSGGGNNVIMAVSGQLAPEPASLSLLGLGTIGLLARRRSARA